ncbi:TPA: hypothetical protein ACS72K_003136 [Providencia alcalifaciens]
MEFKHSPAPWIAVERSDGYNIEEKESDSGFVAHVPKQNNAHLIAAAPELLDALIQAADYMWEDTRDVNFDGTMIFGVGYDWGGWDGLREEIHTQKGSFAIWPSGLNREWYAYGGKDGTYWSIGFKTKQEARNAVIKHLINLVPNHPAVLAHLAIEKALGQQ